jgi:hypothetical protein
MKRTYLAIGLVLAAVNPLAAQDAEDSGRGVARLSLIAGDVSVRRGDTGEWVAAAVNAPLLADDRVLTGTGSRAEVQFDYANFARLSSDAELRLADLENRKYLVRLARGTMVYRILRNQEADAEISTPSIAIRPLKKGMYRVSVSDDGTTEVIVRSGEAEIYSPRGTQKLRPGRALLARGNSNDPEFQIVDARVNDDFDRWSDSRDRQLERSQSYSHVSRDIYGAEDLDGHGRWVSTPEYGSVWVPYSSEGWAPYRNGRWTWVDYYGWNWVSYDPWGWAPYHYGRWMFRVNVGWCWWPGYINRRHYWSPAQVAFFGWGGRYGGIGIGVGFGNWGWVPLAPYETYYPWYGGRYYGGYRNRTYNNVTIINNTNITNIYRNARVDNAITAVNANDFGRGSVNHVRYNRNDIESASHVRGQLPLVPDASSTRLSDREARVSEGRGATRSDDRFFATRQATRGDRVPFETQRQALQESNRRTFGEGAAGRGGEVAGGRGGVTEGGRGGATEGGRGAGDVGRGSDGFGRRGGEATTATESRTADSVGRGSVDANTESRGGWRRFGDSAGSADSGGRGARTTEPARGNADSIGRGSSDTGSESRGGWRRFGDSAGNGNSETRTNDSFGRGSRSSEPARGNTDNGGWRRMSEMPNMDAGRGSRSDTGFGRGSSRNESRTDSRREESPRMSPPVVRERSEPSFGGGRGESRERSMPTFGGGRGESRERSMPTFGGSRGESRERSAPSFGGGDSSRGESRGGFGGGASRSESRGGGGERSAPSPAPSNDGGGGRGGDGGGGRGESRGGGGRIR